MFVCKRKITPFFFINTRIFNFFSVLFYDILLLYGLKTVSLRPILRLKTLMTMKKLLISLCALMGLTTAMAQEQKMTPEMDVFTTKSGKSVTFHALMHASIRIVYDGRELQIDPVRRLGQRTTDYAAMPKTNYILVTHEHGDHFDKQAIDLLTGEGTRLVTNQRCADQLGCGEVMANGDRLVLADDISLEAVPAYNNTEGRQQFHPKGRDNGFVLTIDGLRIYIAGDTEDVPEMANLKDIDIAFLPCNQPYTMTTEQLVRAARTVKPKVLFPYHYGQTDLNSVPQQLKADGIDVRIRHYE